MEFRILLVVGCLAMLGSAAEAQNSSLLYQGPPLMRQALPLRTVAAQSGNANATNLAPPPQANAGVDADRPPILMEDASWTFTPAPPTRVFQINDVVTIRVDEITRVMAEGSTESRRRGLFEAILTDWIRITGFRLTPDPQNNGDPAISGESNQQFRTEATVETRESMTFNIAATVVDIRPNGNLVLEARKAIRVNDNLWETSLSGICRAIDIGPDNVVLSKDLIDLEVRKADRGHLRDGYKRGWFVRWLDRAQPF